MGGQETKIGTLVTDSETTRSYYGDEKLLFRHQKLEDDLELRPEWAEHEKKYSGVFNEVDPSELAAAQKNEMFDCPFAFLL